MSAFDDADKAADGSYVSVVNNYFTMIRTIGVGADSWEDLLDSSYNQQIQYSTPGQAGDGTAMLVLLMSIMGRDGAIDYLRELQANNVGPSSSTGKLGPKVSKGELAIANSDVQMGQQSIATDGSNYEIFFPLENGVRSTIALPYTMALASDAPHKDNALQLMEFLLSADVQAALPEQTFGFPVRSDANSTSDNMTTLSESLDGIDVIEPDWSTIIKELDEDIATYNEATGQ